LELATWNFQLTYTYGINRSRDERLEANRLINVLGEINDEVREFAYNGCYARRGRVSGERKMVLEVPCTPRAGILNRSNLRTGNGNRWTRERVTSLRSHHKIPVYRPSESGVEPWLNLSKAAAH
jgi:hypothetical protein